MIGISRLYVGHTGPADTLRYGRPGNTSFCGRARKPVVVWNMTRKCNLECVHCYAQAEQTGGDTEMSSGEARRFIADLADFGTPVLLFSGGEPLRADLYDIARAASEQNMRVAVATCGSQLSREAAGKLRRSGVSAISISLDAANAADHDAFRGVTGAFEASLRGIRIAREAGLPFQVNTTVTATNHTQLPALARLAEREGARTLDVFFLVPAGRGRALRALQLNAQQVERILQWILEERGRRTLHIKSTCAPQMARLRIQRGEPPEAGSRSGCLAGRGFLFISHTGRVQPCGFLDISCGNVRTFDFDMSALLEASETLQRLATPHGRRGKCAQCDYRVPCGGCRARAFEMEGDPLAAEPFCAYP